MENSQDSFEILSQIFWDSSEFFYGFFRDEILCLNFGLLTTLDRSFFRNTWGIYCGFFPFCSLTWKFLAKSFGKSFDNLRCLKNISERFFGVLGNDFGVPQEVLYNICNFDILKDSLRVFGCFRRFPSGFSRILTDFCGFFC